ncbi:MAG TPA: hypothetical protein VF590_03100 [Isosphaeraceae bacterium]|jgi:hypothetical protein
MTDALPRWMGMLLLAVVVLSGCDPNPGGPSAPSAPAAGPAPATTRPAKKPAKGGAVRLRVPD